MDHQHHGSHGSHEMSEVSPNVTYKDGELLIELKDKDGNVPELEVSHEKMMHLVVISSDLSAYHHLHPEDRGNGKYAQKIKLPHDTYKVFVDINPKGLNYSVKPIDLTIGEPKKDLGENELVADTDFTKKMNNETDTKDRCEDPNAIHLIIYFSYFRYILKLSTKRRYILKIIMPM
ncbi:hypothetical protein ACFSKI_13470 [Pseudogracilibacillus auburnensis]|uniref:Uncharacterized protein n=1 Tax=Pseudogracilibacillus auburnensis TaxID=1494959 RepID=A0A2V3WP53_9BACI|nr:hypothetical protein [Pseudogracilibacillus auburnensis]PXW90489.1 hypothetical protein DFR56_101401 [Pseudogracilibacillus auburnensis]